MAKRWQRRNCLKSFSTSFLSSCSKSLCFSRPSSVQQIVKLSQPNKCKQDRFKILIKWIFSRGNQSLEWVYSVFVVRSLFVTISQIVKKSIFWGKMWKCHQFEKKRDKISDHSQNFFSRDNKNRIDQTEKAASLNEHQVKKRCLCWIKLIETYCI